MKELLTSFFVLEGFTPVSTNLENYTLFLRKETGYITALFVYEERPGEILSQAAIRSLKEGAFRLLAEKNLEEIHALFLLMTNNVMAAMQNTYGERNAWIMDVGRRTLEIPPDRVEDFYGLKGKLNEFLQNPVKAQTILNDVQTQLNRSVREKQRAEQVQRKSFTPFVTIGIMALNVLMLGISYYLGDWFTDLLDLDPLAVFNHNQWYRIFTYMYLHSGYTHILSNMVMLFAVGSVLEPALGRVKFFVFYHVLGLLAGVGSLAFKVLTGEVIPSVGASGAIMGIMGILLFFSIRHFRALRNGRSYRIIMLGLCALDSVYQGFTMKGVDNAAHVTGLVAGVIVGLIVDLSFRSKNKKVQ